MFADKLFEHKKFLGALSWYGYVKKIRKNANRINLLEIANQKTSIKSER